MYSWLVPNAVFPVYERLSGRRPWGEMKRLRRLQWCSPEELEARSIAKVRSVLEHAIANVPYYSDLFRAAGVQPSAIKSIADLSRVPITMKTDLRPGFPDRVVAERLLRDRGVHLHTSGSTGMPFQLFADRADFDSWKGSMYFFREWAGRSKQQRSVVIVGATGWERHRALLSSIPWKLSRLMTVERETRLYAPAMTPRQILFGIEEGARRGPYNIRGFPSYLCVVANHILAHGVVLPTYPSVIITGAETLTTAATEVIRRAFRCRVLNKYSSWEVPHLAQTCPDNPELLHINSERGIVRVVRLDGAPAGAGERGRLILTSLGNYVMPFINYDIGDWGSTGPVCGCGRGFPTLSALDGRTIELIRTPAGKLISSASLGSCISHVPSLGYVAEFQACQPHLERVHISVVPARDFNAEFAQRLKARLESFFGPGMIVTLAVVDHIPAEPSGKRLTVKSDLDHSGVTSHV